MTSRWAPCCLRGAIYVTFAYLCVGELLPLPAIKASRPLLQDWAAQQVVLLMVISSLCVLLASTSSTGGCSYISPEAAARLLATLNVAPIMAAVAATHWFPMSDNCPVAPGEDCDQLGFALDAVGLVSARLARLDLVICLLLAARGGSSWLFGATNGYLGYAEAIPLHRVAGWWCAGQSVLHSVAYLLFYPESGGLRSLWRDCFPTPLPEGKLNRLGLVNGLGALALLVVFALVLPALPPLRRRCYHLFQRLHLPLAALFVLCCALHDLPVLLFAVPGLAVWYLGWRGDGSGGNGSGGDGSRGSGSRCSPPRLTARAHVLAGTSGPWVELTVDCGVAMSARGGPAPRGRWMSVRVLPLGREMHPLSVGPSLTGSLTCSLTGDTAGLSAVVSAQAGDWSQALAAIAQSTSSTFEVQVEGPFPSGGGGWSLGAEDGAGGREPALLLLAGGTGVTGWLSVLASCGGTDRRCQLVWCVQLEADYLALAACLPPKGGVEVSVYVTRATAAADGELLPSMAREWQLDTARPTRPLQGGRPRAPLVSLAATIVGLAAGYWGWEYAADMLGLGHGSTGVGWLHTTLTGYFVSRRCPPIMLIAASIAVAMALFERACVSAPACVPTNACAPCNPAADTELGAVSPRRPQEPLLPAAHGTSSREGCAHQASVAARGHQVRVGRPDFNALVRAAAAGLETQRLVVAACGPPKLVEAARKAAAHAQKELRGVQIEFSGSDSRW